MHDEIQNSFRKNSTRSVLVSLALFSLSCLPAYAGTYDLRLSTSSNHPNSGLLSGKSVSGNIYVFSSLEKGVTRVQFFLNNPNMTGTLRQPENYAPYAFARTSSKMASNPFNANPLATGSHTLTAKIILSAGTTKVVSSTFTIARNATPTPALTPTPRPVPTLTPTSVTSNQPSKVSLGNDGTIIVNGKSFFPFGFYHVSSISPDWSTTRTKRLNDLQEIAKAGFNTIRPEIGVNDESDVLFLKEALRLGVYVLPNFSYQPKVSYENRIAIVSKLKNNPAILGWDIADDVDHPNNNFTPDQILGWDREVKQIDSNHLTYTSGGFLNKIEPFIHSSDIVGFQSYPIDNDPADTKPLRNNYYTYYSLLTAKLNNNGNSPGSEPILDKRTIIANLQAFPWANKPPTAQEVRNMTYAALINGVKGILYYTYFDGNWYLPIHTDLWNGIKSLVPEIQTLTPVLLNGALTKIDTKVDDLYAGQWTYKNSVYIVILNTNPYSSIQASITIPPQFKGSAQPLFSGRPKGMVYANGELSGMIQPGDVHVYKISE